MAMEVKDDDGTLASIPNRLPYISKTPECYRLLFDRLELVDLLNMADANKELRAFAEMAFEFKYSRKRLFLNEVTHSNDRRINESTLLLSIEDFRTSIQTLRCFGHLISEVQLFCPPFKPNDENPSIWKRIIFCVNKFGSNSLKVLYLDFPTEHLFDEIEQSFQSIERIDISSGTLDNKMTQFNKWFPKMNTLKLYINEMQNTNCINEHFPNLKNLIVGTAKKQNGLTKANISDCFRLNPQLMSFQMYGYCDLELLRAISELAPSLAVMDIRCEEETLSKFAGDPMQFKELKSLFIDFSTSKSIPKIPFAAEQLEIVTIELHKNTRINDNLFDFFNKHPTIKKFGMKYLQMNTDIEDKLKIINALPALESIDFGFESLSADEINFYFNHIKLLKEIILCTSNTTKFDALQRDLDENWKISRLPDDQARIERINK